MKAFLTNGQVAWELPRNIAPHYMDGYYTPWGDWFILPELSGDWVQGESGEWRTNTPAINEREKVMVYDD